MVTFLIETIDKKEVLGYFKTLKDAKNELLASKLLQETACILKLKGNYFGEGFHKYRVFLKNNNWKYERY